MITLGENLRCARRTAGVGHFGGSNLDSAPASRVGLAHCVVPFFVSSACARVVDSRAGMTEKLRSTGLVSKCTQDAIAATQCHSLRQDPSSTVSFMVSSTGEHN
jgi:hypothetical protein